MEKSPLFIVGRRHVDATHPSASALSASARRCSARNTPDDAATPLLYISVTVTLAPILVRTHSATIIQRNKYCSRWSSRFLWMSAHRSSHLPGPILGMTLTVAERLQSIFCCCIGFDPAPTSAENITICKNSLRALPARAVQI